MMQTQYRLTEAEARLADIIWNNEPIVSPELVRICEKEFSWKKSTTYTMLKRLEQKELFINKVSVVSSLVSKSDFFAKQSKLYVSETFGGSLPKFLAAFTSGKKLSRHEIDELQQMIDKHKEG